MTRLLSTAATRNDIGQNPPEAHCSETWTTCLVLHIASLQGDATDMMASREYALGSPFSGRSFTQPL